MFKPGEERREPEEVEETLEEVDASDYADPEEAHDEIERKINRMFDLLTDVTIDKDMFTKKIKEYKDQQYLIEEKTKQFTVADESFYLNVNMLLHVVKKASVLFENSEPDTKRQILNFLLQNCELDEKKLNFTLKKPFDGLLLAQRFPSRRGQGDSNP